MFHTQKRHIIIALFAIGSFLCVPTSPALANHADGKSIGTVCTSNNECKSHHCEESDTATKQKYCTCDVSIGVDSDDCNEYGEIPNGGWECKNGDHATFDLNYCVSDNNVRPPEFPLTPLRDPTLADRILSPTLTNEELRNLKITPKTVVRIPGLEFSEIKTETESDGITYLFIPFLGEYIAAVYRYGVAAGAVVAVVMIIRGGLIWTISGGNESQIGHAKDIIGKAVIGLALAVGSYTILYTINPDLVTFKNLRIQFIAAKHIDSLEFDKHSEFNFNANIDVSRADLDKVFKAYAGCHGYDWRILKAFAAAESGLNPNARRPGSKYHGLFQMSQDYCIEGLRLGKYPASLKFNCETRIEAETNTAATAPTVQHNLKKIRSSCPTITVADAMTLLYVAHNNGPAVMNHVLKKSACSQPSMRGAVASYYEARGGNSRGVSVAFGLKKHDYGRQKVVGALEKMGVTDQSNIYPDGGKNPAQCPANTKKRVLTPGEIEQAIGGNVQPVGDIACPNGDGKKIIAVGDSITAANFSYASIIDASCDNVEIVKMAYPGRSASFVYDQIQNRDFSAEGFTDMIVLAGVNDVNNAQRGLQRIYQKAHSENLRVVAITLTPWGNYRTWTEQRGQMTHTINNWIRGRANGHLEANDIIVDVYGALGAPGNPDALNPAYTQDHLHPNQAGHEVIASQVAGAAL